MTGSQVQDGPEPKSVVDVAVRIQGLAAVLRSEAAITSRPGQLARLEDIAGDLAQLASCLVADRDIPETHHHTCERGDDCVECGGCEEGSYG